jgi:4-amino-4-deoxy-L-arabinose transferase-like glycosyltransferase
MKLRIPGVLLFVACLLPFIRLGLGEIQPWDESLYVIRADACLKFGVWLDQTQYAVGHLYSSTHPPLGVWLIAISKYFFGGSTFAIRLPMAMGASGSILLLWAIVCKFASKDAALIAAVSLSAADLFLEFSHRAQMESLLLFFCLAAIYLLIKAIERDRWIYTILSGVLLGLGLLTKLSEAIFIIPFAFLLPWCFAKPKRIWFVGFEIVTSFIVAFPWFMVMASRHPEYWNHVYIGLDTIRAGGYAPSSLAWWYYLNQLLVSMPLIIIVLCTWNASKWFRSSLTWIVLMMIVLQLVGTKMPHFAFLLLAPAAFLIGTTWDRVREMSAKGVTILYCLILFVIIWSSSEQLRMFFTHRISWAEIQMPIAGSITIVITMIVALLFWRFIPREPRNAIVLSTLLLGIALTHLISESASVYDNGASQIASILQSHPEKNDLIVIHSDFPNEAYAPQLAYRTGGWTLGWIPGKFSRAITWDSAAMNSYIPDSSKQFAVVTRFEDRFYHRPASEIAVWDTLTQKLRHNFFHERMFRSYVLYY